MPPKRSNKLTREQERDLDIEIGFIEGVVRRAPGFIEALQILGDDYTRRGRFADGLKLDEQLARLRPDDALVHRSEEHTSELQSRLHLVCRLLLEKKKRATRSALTPGTRH